MLEAEAEAANSSIGERGKGESGTASDHLEFLSQLIRRHADLIRQNDSALLVQAAHSALHRPRLVDDVNPQNAVVRGALGRLAYAEAIEEQLQCIARADGVR